VTNENMPLVRDIEKVLGKADRAAARWKGLTIKPRHRTKKSVRAWVEKPRSADPEPAADPAPAEEPQYSNRKPQMAVSSKQLILNNTEK